jgi:RNA polymerase sigma factor (sigma-70 family)
VNARLFEELRPVGFAVAYRMLGSVSEAEDIIQEAFLRLHHTLQDGERIESPRAYLSTVVTRLCINHLRSARARRETYVEALPEPLVGEPGAAVPLAGEPTGRVPDAGGDPASHAERADSLSLAFLVLLETLSPEQRAAFLLREVFDYPTTRSPRSWRPASRTPASSWPGPGGTSSSDGPASSRRASNGSAWPDGSSPPPRTATSARSRSCWPTT